MDTRYDHRCFGSEYRSSQSLRNDLCQNILYKAVLEHFDGPAWIATLLMASKSFQNSSFGANFLLNFVVHDGSIDLLESVLSPSSCFSLQFVPALCVAQMKSTGDSETANLISNFVGELVKTKYLHSSLRSLWLDSASNDVLSCFFGSSTSCEWPQLRDLTLDGCGLNDNALEIISKKALQLRSVSLSNNSDITDGGLEHLCKLSGITSLNLSWCVAVTDVGLESFSKLSDITFLNLTCCRLNLTCCSAIADPGLESVSKLSSISSLELCRCNLITDVGLEHLSKLSSSIASLCLSYCNLITDIGLEHISNLASITFLDLSECHRITDLGLEHVAKLSSITSLNFYNCRLITDVGLESVSKLTSITSLSLGRCDEITDAGLEHVATLSCMTQFDLRCSAYFPFRISKITAEAKQKLKAALPNCNMRLQNNYFCK